MECTMRRRKNAGTKDKKLKALRKKYRDAHGSDWSKKPSVYKKYKAEMKKQKLGEFKSSGKSAANKGKGKGSSSASPFAKAGAALKELGVQKLSAKKYDTLEKRQAEIKKLRAKGKGSSSSSRSSATVSIKKLNDQLRKLGYSGKLNGKTVSTVEKKQAKIKALKAKAAAKGKGSSSSSKGSAKKPKKNAYIRYMEKHGGKGWSQEQLLAGYKKGKAPTGRRCK